jgi:hypothetical protein
MKYANFRVYNISFVRFCFFSLLVQTLWLAFRLLFYLFIYTANGFLSGGTDTTIRHNTQITPHSNKTQHTELHSNKGHTIQNEYNANMIIQSLVLK